MKPLFKWLFAASLIANIFLAGFILGHSAPYRMDRPLNKKALAELAPDKREAVEKLMNNLRERRKEDFAKLRKARDEAADILEAQTFDEERFLEKAKAADVMFASGKQKMMQDMATLAKGFNQKERHVLAGMLRRPPIPPRGDKEKKPD